MKKPQISKEVQDVIFEESNRSKRKIDIETREQNKKFENEFYKLLKEGEGKAFRAFLMAHGMRERDKEFKDAMRLWGAYQREKRKNVWSLST